MKKLSDVVDSEVVRNTKFNTLKTKVNNFDKKIPDATTLIHINQYNTYKQNLEKKNWSCWLNNTRYKRLSDYNCFEYEINKYEIPKLVKLRMNFLIMINILLLKNLIS